MSLNRRNFIGIFAATVTATLLPFHVLASIISWPKHAFSATKTDDAVQLLFNNKKIVSANSKQVKLKIPKASKTGNSVFVSIKSTLSHTESISLFIKNSPEPLIAIFQIPEEAIAGISTYIRIPQTSTIIIIVKAAGVLYSRSHDIRIQSGGCGE